MVSHFSKICSESGPRPRLFGDWSGPSGLVQSISPVKEMNADPYGPHTAYKYLAGIWRDYIPMQLLWCVHEGGGGATGLPPVHTHPLHYRALTWSWLSIDGSVDQSHPCHQLSVQSRIDSQSLRSICSGATDHCQSIHANTAHHTRRRGRLL
jgi:hypothetical protein